MNSYTIKDSLWDEQAAQHPAWKAFVDLMATKEYGEEPLNRAWAFFKKGWDSKCASSTP